MGLVTCLLSWCAWQFVDFTNRSQVIIFFLALIIVTIINTSTGIWALVRHERVDVLPVDYLNQVFEHAVSNDKASWDRMYFKLRCCGVNGPIDYRDHDAVPWSCCDTTSVLANSDDSIGTCNTMYAKGCHQVVINRTRSILLHVFLLALCTVLLQRKYYRIIIIFEEVYESVKFPNNQTQKNSTNKPSLIWDISMPRVCYANDSKIKAGAALLRVTTYNENSFRLSRIVSRHGVS
ncbi:tetraspanin-3-like isoform X3 [Hylaeus anthracinus]|nr:tetraspanin-3-like isoform X3 [Hylaeus anthracinus]XP_054001623.1 tetraspanin-3-like isoform X3 [Hylaeus anthracinus]XP_054001624.1 tetraspanin-3-like isoform X3 [Hylaeus anthracinus]